MDHALEKEFTETTRSSAVAMDRKDGAASPAKYRRS